MLKSLKPSGAGRRRSARRWVADLVADLVTLAYEQGPSLIIPFHPCRAPEEWPQAMADSVAACLDL